MPATNHERLDRILAIPYPSDFLLALAELDSTPGDAPWPFGVFRSLSHFYHAAESGWISEYLRSEAGAEFATALAACEAVGASQAAAYLRAVAAYFPDGIVPTDEAERTRRVEAIRLRKSPTKALDVLGELSEQYATAFPELVVAVRRFVDHERDAIIAALERLDTSRSDDAATPEKLPTPEPTQQRKSGPAGTGTGVLAAGARFLAAASARPLPVPDASKDVRLRRFVNRLIALDADQWLLVSRRYAADPERVNRAMDYASNLPYRKLYPTGQFDALVHSATAVIRKPLLARLDALPEEISTDEGQFPLRRVAREAGLRAVFVVSRHDWLVATEQGRHALDVLLAPFGGVPPL